MIISQFSHAEVGCEVVGIRVVGVTPDVGVELAVVVAAGVDVVVVVDDDVVDVVVVDVVVVEVVVVIVVVVGSSIHSN
jgi:hypothetical protein